ncbi:GDSL esterase/lipase [Thalictrum thalictroides]|uniref:GDSL esterase/lipase n=1 Tax=Thalictrum thalictroides TaxID=46969 RepID=A0A7J6VVN1_THATH|nr:GDSL esterase/lipase [Thalictrum thalictroides]
MAERYVLISLILVVFSLSKVATSTSTTPAVFIFGDSTADVGTNNFINETKAKADFPHNGVDFPGSRPTGRFSNGYNSADFVSKLMGFKRSPPPYLALITQQQRLHRRIVQAVNFYGVNFASGGSGLLNETGNFTYVRVIPMAEQIQHFTKIREMIIDARGQESTDTFLSRSLFFLSVGSNDIFEYFGGNGTASDQSFITFLKITYELHLRMLYSLGARKFGIVSVPLIGCCPSQRIHNITEGGCLEDMNLYSHMFFLSIEDMLGQLSLELTDIKYSLGNANEMVKDFMDNPLALNFTEISSACCGNGTNPCSPNATLCPNRNQHLFWDLYHPTQAAAQLAALTLYGGSRRFVTPINFMQLAAATF